MSLIATSEDLASVADVIDLNRDFYIYHDLNSIADDELKAFRRNLITPAATVCYSDDEDDIVLQSMFRNRSNKHLAYQKQFQRPVSRGESVLLFKKINNGDDEVSVDLLSSELKDFIDADFTMTEMYSRPASIITMASRNEPRYKEHRNPHKQLIPAIFNYNQPKKPLLTKDEYLPRFNKKPTKTLETILENSKQSNISKKPKNLKEEWQPSLRSPSHTAIPTKSLIRPVKPPPERIRLRQENHKTMTLNSSERNTNTRITSKGYEEPRKITHHSPQLLTYSNNRRKSAQESLQDTSCTMKSPPNKITFTKKRSTFSQKYNSTSSSSSSSEEEDLSYYRHQHVRPSRKSSYEDASTQTEQRSNTLSYKQPHESYMSSYYSSTRSPSQYVHLRHQTASNDFQRLARKSHSTQSPATLSEEGLSVANSAKQVLASIQKRRKMMEPTTNKSRYDNNSFVNEFRSKLNISDYAMKAGAAANKLVVTTSMNKKALHRNYEETKSRYLTRIPQRPTAMYH